MSQEQGRQLPLVRQVVEAVGVVYPLIQSRIARFIRTLVALCITRASKI
jgi:hypothetical protein